MSSHTRKRFAQDRRVDPRCHWCGHRMSVDDVSRDHVVPRVLGGPTTPTNTVFACKRCNALKGDLTPELFLEVLHGRISRTEAMARNGTFLRSRQTQAERALARERAATGFYLDGVPAPVVSVPDPPPPPRPARWHRSIEARLPEATVQALRELR